jgi:hypothetical protein
MTNRERIIQSIGARIAARRRPKAQQYLSRIVAATEIARALNISHDAAMMTLYGLCACGNLTMLNGQQEIVDIEECTIANLDASVAFVSATDLRQWLNECAPGPQASQRDAVIERLLQTKNPPRDWYWKEFCDAVRNQCNGWRAKGKPAWGFGDRQIKSVVKQLRGI